MAKPTAYDYSITKSLVNKGEYLTLIQYLAKSRLHTNAAFVADTVVYALEKDKNDIVEKMAQHLSPASHARLNLMSCSFTTLFHRTVIENKPRTLEQLLFWSTPVDQKVISVDGVEFTISPYLIHCVMNNFVAVGELLIKHAQADRNTLAFHTNPSVVSLLALAVVHNHKDMFDMLVRHDSLMLPTENAIFCSRAWALEYLFDRVGVPLDTRVCFNKDHFPDVSILAFTILNRKQSTIDFVVSRRPPVTDQERSLIIYCPYVLNEMLRRGLLDPNYSIDGVSAVEFSIDNGLAMSTRLLLHYGARVTIHTDDFVPRPPGLDHKFACPSVVRRIIAQTWFPPDTLAEIKALAGSLVATANAADNRLLRHLASHIAAAHWGASRSELANTLHTIDPTPRRSACDDDEWGEYEWLKVFAV